MADNINKTLEDLAGAIIDLEDCLCGRGASVGQQSDDTGLSSADIDIGPVGQFESFPDYQNAKCNVANAIYDTLLGGVIWLVDNNVDLIGGAFGSITVGIAAHVLVGPIGWAAIVIELTVAALAAYLVAQNINLTDLRDNMINEHSAIVLALYNAGTPRSAEDAVIFAMGGGVPSVTAVETGLIRLMLPKKMLNQLFAPTEDMARFPSSNPIACGATIQTWSFPVSGEGWTFRDDSDTPNSSAGAWSAAEEGWQFEVSTAAGNNGTAKGTIYLDGLSIAVTPANAVQFDFSPSSDGVNSSLWLKVIFDDMSEEETSLLGYPASGTIVHAVGATKTIAAIECSVSRSFAVATVFTREILEVRVQ